MWVYFLIVCFLQTVVYLTINTCQLVNEVMVNKIYYIKTTLHIVLKLLTE